MPLLFKFKYKAKLFKDLFDALKQFLTDNVNLEITPEGLKILSIDSATGSVLIQLIIHAEKLTEFICNVPTIIGINIPYWSKLFKKVTANHDLTVQQSSSKNTDVRIILENSKRNDQLVIDYHLKETAENDAPVIDDLEYNCQVKIPSSYFQDICNHMKAIGVNLIELTQSGNSLTISSKNEESTQTIVLNSNEFIENRNNRDEEIGSDSDDEQPKEKKKRKTVSRKSKQEDAKIEVIHNDNEQNEDMYQGKFNLETLLDLTKCSKLNDGLQICMANDNPLLLIIDLGIGELKLAVAPKVDEKNDSENQEGDDNANEINNKNVRND